MAVKVSLNDPGENVAINVKIYSCMLHVLYSTLKVNSCIVNKLYKYDESICFCYINVKG